MALEGLRLAVVSEAPEYAKFDTEQVKRLTGDDRLSGRNPFESRNREFKPTHTCLMVGNDEPVPPTGDQAFWDRVFLIHFNARFVKANPDPARGERLADPLMEEKLMEMGPQILAWAVEGCMQWQTDGCRLRPPKSVLKSTEEYREDADWLGQFLEACCEKRPGAQVQAANLHAALALWWAENINDRKNTVPSAQMLGRKMRKLGAYPPDRSTGRAMYGSSCGRAEVADPGRTEHGAPDAPDADDRQDDDEHPHDPAPPSAPAGGHLRRGGLGREGGGRRGDHGHGVPGRV